MSNTQSFSHRAQRDHRIAVDELRNPAYPAEDFDCIEAAAHPHIKPTAH